MTDEELVREVAEKVMEWDKAGWNGQRYTRWLPRKPPSYEIGAWNPLTDANHRDMVVEKMREKGWVVEINNYIGWNNNRPNAWAVRFKKYQEPNQPYAANINLGHAVVLAALAAVKKEA